MAHRCEHLSSELYHTFNVRAGDTVALVSPNSVDYNSAFHAVLKLGARVTTANPLYSAEELRLQLDLAGAKVIYTISAFEELARKTAALPSPSTGKVESIGVLLADRPLKVGDKPVPIPSSEQGFIKGRGDDTVVVPFSSGTTGLPKGVQLTNRNLITNLYQTDSALESRQSDVSIAVLPYFHIYGMTVVMNGMMLHGAKQIVVPKFDIVSFLELLQKHKATLLFVAPPMIVGFVKHPNTKLTDTSSVRRVLSGAAPLHRDVQKMAEEIFSKGTVCQGYGLSETSPVATVALPGVTGSAGALIADCEMRIIRVGEQEGGGEATEGIDVAEGEEGEIWFRGPNIMKGYLKQEDTDKVMAKGGWFRTGDIGKVDVSNEHLIITDRLKELIKFKGFQVAPAELEGLLQTHPLVLETIVVGIPDPLDRGCELPRAQVALRPTATEDDIKNIEQTLMKFVEQHVAPYKKLRGGVRVVPAVPKSPAGKLLRRIAKAQELEHLKEHPRFPHATYQ
ncbi:4-coumarate:CoA ligase-like protein, putative [Bodo saltans]|uniref:4-coumarate:CoA ligase-like protein, putative n=1 Tax=Bodo saltans TaxID=75058 RepID=A0A0S4J3H6_BODSA|nr:4-coumarate:CoA ligase-like protein, putative [Bodo saltans]|eukprot:CUG76562.1 4-coumarate:CoA ligase-like protein, putative [Bodo saltans]